MLLEKKKLKVEDFKVKNIYFLCHTLTNLKTKSWNGKSTFQTTSKTIFTDLNSYFDINVNALIYIDFFSGEHIKRLKHQNFPVNKIMHVK